MLERARNWMMWGTAALALAGCLGVSKDGSGYDDTNDSVIEASHNGWFT